MAINIDTKLERKLTWLSNMHEEFSKFLPEHVRKSKIGDLDGILLSKAENV